MSHSNLLSAAGNDADYPQSRSAPDASELNHQQTVKRTNGNNNGLQGFGENSTFFKILVPSMAAGAIIGKGGETIAMLQQQTQTRIKMSKATDYFPGTNERVCIVYGPAPESILQVHDFIAQKIRDKPDPAAKTTIDFETKQPAEREKQIKILVPNSTAGMIIGKGGNYIKFIKEESGAYVQISQKAKDHAISERCITVIGDTDQNRKACGLILNKIFEDPQSNSCPNLSYADFNGPVPNYNPTGSPFTNIGHAPTQLDHHGHASIQPFANGLGNSAQFFANLRTTLRLTGYSEDATNEILGAMSTLASYGILGLGLGLGGLNMGYMSPMNGGNSADSGYLNSNGSSLAGGLSSSSMGANSPGAYSENVSSASKSPVRYNPHQESLDSTYGGSTYDQQPPSQSQATANELWGQNNNRARWSAHRAPYGHQNSASGDATVPAGQLGERTQITIEINENLVGALLGREGKNVAEIEQICGTQVQVTPKKKFSNGRRAVTITGSLAAVEHTQYLINQRLAQAEERRNQNENNGTSAGSSPPQQLPMSPSSQFA